MNVSGTPRRTLWLAADGFSVEIIDQRKLPHAFVIERLRSLEDVAEAIRGMAVRGAPLIGVTAAYGLCLALREDSSNEALERARQLLLQTRPTAINLRWALDQVCARIEEVPVSERVAIAYATAAELAEQDVKQCRAIGEHGVELIAKVARENGGKPVQVLTHCNAGWLATIDWGTALAPIYMAAERKIPIHVWVDETRPRNQGAALTAWELAEAGIAHTLIADNVGGHLMQHGRVDLCIVGSDRTTASGDVCNKIGTYLKALAAHANRVPFYAAVPSSTIDWTLHDGVKEIPIEQRDGRELTHMTGKAEDGRIVTVAIAPAKSPAANFAFDVTPSNYVTGIITERGVCAATPAGLAALFPERAR